MTDQEKKDLAQSYRTMMDQGAWKHFSDTVLGKIERDAINDFDLFAISPSTLADLGEARGRRRAVMKIRSEINYILEGLK